MSKIEKVLVQKVVMVYWLLLFNGERSSSINHREKERALHINESDHHKAKNEDIYR